MWFWGAAPVYCGETTTALDEEKRNGFWKSMLICFPGAARSGPSYPYLARHRSPPAETVEEMTFVAFSLSRTPSGG